MEIRFERLTPSLKSAFFRFFDNDAFSDHEEWAGCYCLESHIPMEGQVTDRAMRRQMAEDLIDQGKLTGYLLFDGERPVGWCNAGDKSEFSLAKDGAFHTIDDPRGEVKVIYCIDIAPEYRGRGLAREIFRRAISDARDEGYRYVEGYPLSDLASPYPYKGPIALYHESGFRPIREAGDVVIMQKEL